MNPASIPAVSAGLRRTYHIFPRAHSRAYEKRVDRSIVLISIAFADLHVAERESRSGSRQKVYRSRGDTESDALTFKREYIRSRRIINMYARQV